MRTFKKAKPYKLKNNHAEILKVIKKEGYDILESPQFMECASHMQHGTVSVKNHCINVAVHSVKLSKKLGVKCNQRALIRGALLHDYFLYDWHSRKIKTLKELHGFCHPTTALENASREYELSLIEEDIIKKHMWPMTVVPPLCREAWLVTLADKYCSTLETLHIHRGKRKMVDK